MTGHILFTMESGDFFKEMKKIVEQVLEECGLRPGDRISESGAQQQRLLKAKQVCELFHVSKPTLYQWMHDGKLKSIKIQSRRFFLLKDIEALIKNNYSGA